MPLSTLRSSTRGLPPRWGNSGSIAAHCVSLNQNNSAMIDNHWGMLFKAAILSTVLSVGSEAGTSDNENSLVQAIRQGASQSFSQVGEQVVGRSLNVQPTITIRPGFPVRVLVTHDLVLEPYQS